MIYTLDQAVERCKYWQAVLRLQDWNVTLIFGRYHEMGGTALAQCRTANAMRRATLVLLDPADFRPDDPEEMRDMDDSIVHELLHLHLNDCGVKRAGDGQALSAEQIAEERAIEALAQAFVQLDRRAT